MQQDGITLASSEPVVVELMTKASHTPTKTVSIYGIAPSRVLHESEVFGIALYANAGTSSVDGFQVRLAFDPAVLSFEGFQVSSNFVYAASRDFVAHTSILALWVHFACSHGTALKSSSAVCCERADRQGFLHSISRSHEAVHSFHSYSVTRFASVRLWHFRIGTCMPRVDLHKDVLELIDSLTGHAGRARTST